MKIYFITAKIHNLKKKLQLAIQKHNFKYEIKTRKIDLIILKHRKKKEDIKSN